MLRRVVRRAIRHGRQLGLEDAFLGDVAGEVIEQMGDIYPELRNHQDFILTVLRLEEERFQQAFRNGYEALSEALDGADSLDGEVVFRLWDTYGFPVEMTSEIAAERGVEVDMAGFEEQMASQRERARATAQFGGDRAKIRVYESMAVGATRFLGYEQLTASSVVVGLISGDDLVTEAREDQEVEIVLVETPFYPEGGGQIGDAGQLIGPNGSVEVRDTLEVMPEVIVHFGRVASGSIALGDSVEAYVDEIRREDTARNHTATHLLHAALRQVLGPHVRQAGSLVAPDRLRFDFSHVQPVTDEEMWQVQLLVNEKLRQNARIVKSEDTYASAITRGALAFFGDKYGDRVRLVEIANGATFSFEVCGGTHVQRTGELGAVYVLGESSIGGGNAANRGRQRSRGGTAGVGALPARGGGGAAAPGPPARGGGQGAVPYDSLDEANRARSSLERRLSLQAAESLLADRQDVGGVSVLAARTTAANADGLREVGDWLRDKLGSGVVVLGSVIGDRPLLVSMVTPDLVERGLDAKRHSQGSRQGHTGRRRRTPGRGAGGRKEGGRSGRRAGVGAWACPREPGRMRILALDVGERRIGLALSDPTGLLASPIDAIDLDDREPAHERAARHASGMELSEIVVGMPYSMSGERGRQAGRVAAFVRELAELVEVPVTTVDERLSTAQAERLAAGTGRGAVAREGPAGLGRSSCHPAGLPRLAAAGLGDLPKQRRHPLAVVHGVAQVVLERARLLGVVGQAVVHVHADAAVNVVRRLAGGEVGVAGHGFRHRDR